MKRWLTEKLKDEPGLALSLGYVALTMIGLTYQWALFAKFRVNILDWAEFADFVFACLREPSVPLLCLPAYGIFWLAIRWEDRLLQKAWYVERFMRHEWQRLISRGSRLLIMPLYFFSFAAVFANGMGERILAGRGRRVAIEYNTNVPNAAPLGKANIRPLWIGATSRAIFLYDDTKKETLIVPHGSVARILVEKATPKSGDDDSAN